MSERGRMRIRVVAVDPPFSPGDGVVFGLQRRDGTVDDLVEAASTTTFETAIEWDGGDGEIDVRGEHVNGRRGDRFLYVSWGTGDEQSFEMFARAKLRVAHVPDDLLVDGATLIGEFAATNAKGHPASGTIAPPAVIWWIET